MIKTTTSDRSPNSDCNVTLSPRSRLVSQFFDRLNSLGVVYAVMNNYEDLPRTIPSDIDIAIEPRIFAVLDNHICIFAGESGALVVQKIWHGNRKCAYILAIDTGQDYEFVQLDFFVEFSTRHCPHLIANDELVAGRRVLRNFYTPRPEVELVFTVMRRLFKDDWNTRHCLRVAQLQSEFVDYEWLPARFAWLEETIVRAVAGDVHGLARQRAKSWQHLKKTAREGLSIWAHIRNAIWQARRILNRLRNETGNLSLVFGSVDIDLQQQLEPLNLVFHRRLLLVEDELEHHERRWNLISTLYYALRIKLLKQRKCLVFVHITENVGCLSRLAAALDRSGVVDQLLIPMDRTKNHPFRAPVFAVRVEHDVIKAIVATQVAKTSKAIARAGTQTSG